MATARAGRMQAEPRKTGPHATGGICPDNQGNAIAVLAGRPGLL